MPSRSRDCMPGSVAPVLTPDFLARTHQLNLDYVQLLTDAVHPHAPADALSAPVRHSLTNLTAPALRALAATPYALYSLGFENQDFWMAALSGSEAQCWQTRYASPAALGNPTSSVSRHLAFCEVALFFAWHVAVSHPIAARVLYAIPDPVIKQLRAAQLWRLQQIVLAHPDLLAPRWPANPHFWPDMVRFAASGATRSLQATQLLGCQLIACDLRVAESARRAASGRPRMVRLARPGITQGIRPSNS
jgi:hypothetical protein